MTDTVISTKTADEELIDVLTAISVVSMRLARNKTSEMQSTIQELRDMAVAINEIADQLFSVFSSKAEEAAPEAPAEKPPTLEEVRAILAEKARAGFTSEVRELLGRYGADRLSAADPKHYAAIVKEAEVLGNAG